MKNPTAVHDEAAIDPETDTVRDLKCYIAREAGVDYDPDRATATVQRTARYHRDELRAVVAAATHYDEERLAGATRAELIDRLETALDVEPVPRAIELYEAHARATARALQGGIAHGD